MPRLLHENEFFCLYEFSGRESIEVHSAGKFLRRQRDLVPSHFLPFIHEYRHLAAKDVVQAERDVRPSRHFIPDGGAWIERVRIVLFQSEYPR